MHTARRGHLSAHQSLDSTACAFDVPLDEFLVATVRHQLHGNGDGRPAAAERGAVEGYLVLDAHASRNHRTLVLVPDAKTLGVDACFEPGVLHGHDALPHPVDPTSLVGQTHGHLLRTSTTDAIQDPQDTNGAVDGRVFVNDVVAQVDDHIAVMRAVTSGEQADGHELAHQRSLLNGLLLLDLAPELVPHLLFQDLGHDGAHHVVTHGEDVILLVVANDGPVLPIFPQLTAGLHQNGANGIGVPVEQIVQTNGHDLVPIELRDRTVAALFVGLVTDLDGLNRHVLGVTILVHRTHTGRNQRPKVELGGVAIGLATRTHLDHGTDEADQILESDLTTAEHVHCLNQLDQTGLQTSRLVLQLTLNTNVGVVGRRPGDSRRTTVEDDRTSVVGRETNPVLQLLVEHRERHLLLWRVHHVLLGRRSGGELRPASVEQPPLDASEFTQQLVRLPAVRALGVPVRMSGTQLQGVEAPVLVRHHDSAPAVQEADCGRLATADVVEGRIGADGGLVEDGDGHGSSS